MDQASCAVITAIGGIAAVTDATVIRTNLRIIPEDDDNFAMSSGYGYHFHARKKAEHCKI